MFRLMPWWPEFRRASSAGLAVVVFAFILKMVRLSALPAAAAMSKKAK
jgi:hypothetical protein